MSLLEFAGLSTGIARGMEATVLALHFDFDLAGCFWDLIGV